MNWRAIISTFRLMKVGALLLAFLLVRYLATVMIFGVGAFWIYDGFSRGSYYSLQGQSPVRMTVVKVENRNHRRILPDYVATGFVSNQTAAIEVPLFERQYRSWAGGALDVYPLPSGQWLNGTRLKESMPIFNLMGLHFSWHFPAGILMLGGWFGFLPWLRRKEKQRGADAKQGS